jgi:Spy/CpxP family protein refolding chaperone
MTRMVKILIGAGALALAATTASAAYAQVTTAGDQATPKNFNWEIKDGKRVPKGNRQVNADGSWREEIRQGKCLIIKEKSAAGDYKETRKCD